MTVYQETREQSGVTLYCRSRIASWEGWPNDVVDVLRGWNRDRRLRFVGMDTIGRIPPQQTFKCPDCERFINPSGSTAAKLDGALVCDDCVILRVRKYGPLGRPETELEKCKRWQRNMQKKLLKYRHNALSEAAYVKELEDALRAIKHLGGDDLSPDECVRTLALARGFAARMLGATVVGGSLAADIEALPRRSHVADLRNSDSGPITEHRSP